MSHSHHDSTHFTGFFYLLNIPGFNLREMSNLIRMIIGYFFLDECKKMLIIKNTVSGIKTFTFS